MKGDNVMHIGMADQLQLPKLLQEFEAHRKTGVLIIVQENVREEVYIYQGQVIDVVAAHTSKPLVRRLVHSGLVSLNDLQQIPDNIGQVLRQSQGAEQYSDVQIAKILIQLGLINKEQLTTWARKETAEALAQLLAHALGEIYFEEGVQPPTDRLCAFPTQRETACDNIGEQRPSTKEKSIPVTPFPLFFKKPAPMTAAEQTKAPISQPLQLKQSPISFEPSIPATPPHAIQVIEAILAAPTVLQPAVPVIIKPMLSPTLEVQKRSSLPLASGRANKAQSKMLRRAKAKITIKLTILGSSGLLVGGIASFILLRSTTYLIVSWVILIMVFSNLIIQELRSYYWTGLKMTLTTLRIPAIKIGPQTKGKGVDVGRNQMLKDIHDTTAYLKALRFLSQDNHTSKKG
jgi:hypothetical protein